MIPSVAPPLDKALSLDIEHELRAEAAQLPADVPASVRAEEAAVRLIYEARVIAVDAMTQLTASETFITHVLNS
jgi:hypothetical protein